MGLLGSTEKDQFGRNVGQVAQEYKQRLRSEADWTVLGVLTNSQLKRLDDLLGPGFHAPKPPAEGRPSAPAGGRPGVDQAERLGHSESLTVRIVLIERIAGIRPRSLS